MLILTVNSRHSWKIKQRKIKRLQLTTSSKLIINRKKRQRQFPNSKTSYNTLG